MHIDALPPILILHLKRFLYDASAGVAKVGKQVSFAPELDVPTGGLFLNVYFPQSQYFACRGDDFWEEAPRNAV